MNKDRSLADVVADWAARMRRVDTPMHHSNWYEPGKNERAAGFEPKVNEPSIYQRYLDALSANPYQQWGTYATSYYTSTEWGRVVFTTGVHGGNPTVSEDAILTSDGWKEPTGE